MKARGQVLALLAIALAVIAAAVLTFLALSTLQSVRSHARQCLQMAVIAGARRVAYDTANSGALSIPDEASETVREAFAQALAMSRYGLGAEPEEIALGLEVEIHNSPPWVSPYTGLVHHVPTLAAQVWIPVRLLFFSVNLPLVAEAEVNKP